MLRSFRRLLRRSKDREASPIALESPPETSPAIREASGDHSPPALLLPRRARPQLALHLARLRRQHADLQRRYRLLPPARPAVRRTNLKAAVVRATAETLPSEPAPAPTAARLRAANRAPRGVLASRSTARAISTYRVKEERSQAVLKEAPLKNEASLGAWAATSEDGGRALRQAASAQRIRRLRRFSQTHQHDGGTAEPATAAPVAPDSPHAAALQDKAWSIMAGLNLDDLDKKRGVDVQRKATWGRGGGGSGSESGTRRQTEPPTQREEVAIKAVRSPSDDGPGAPAAAPDGEGKDGFRWRGLSLGRPRTRAAGRFKATELAQTPYSQPELPAQPPLLAASSRAAPSPTMTKRFIALGAAFALLLAASTPAIAGSGDDKWGIDTLVNLPPGKSRGTVPNQAGDTGDSAPIDVPCQCSDADPRRDADQEVGTTCFFHRVYGACNADFMFDANAELAPEGYCQISCSRCSCCVPPSEIIASLGGNRFLQAAAAAQPPLTDALSHPGFVGTILVPSDAAFDALQSKLGPLVQNPAILQQIVKMHILPPEARRNALWTSPFMVLGPKIRTMYDGPAVMTAQKVEPYPSDVTWRGGLTGFTLKGPHNAATVVKSDVPSCKGYVSVIDTVLLPFDPAAAAPISNDFGVAAGAAVGAPGCALAPNALIRGTEVNPGEGNIQKSIGDCCDSCQSTSGCNAWVFCSEAGGCPAADGSYSRPFGYCQLKSSPEVAAGNAPSYEDFSATTVAVSSGYLARNVQAASGAGRRLMAEAGTA